MPLKDNLYHEEGTPFPHVARSEGIELIDTEGRRYIDFLSSWCVGNLGWGQQEIKNAVENFRGPAYVSPHHDYGPWSELAALLTKITPGDLSTCVRCTGGTEAVEAAMQAAMLHTGRRRFLSLEGSYHGNSIATMSLGATPPDAGYVLLQGCDKLAPPLDDTAADKLETLLKRREVAAFIMEPIGMNLTVLVPEKNFMHRAAELCRKYGTLLVMDEVASGFGRTGKLFATEHHGLAPDILCLAKGITGGYAPMGATLMVEEVARSFSEGAGLYSTYGWHPLAVAAAMANIGYMVEHREQLMRNVEEMSEHITARLGRIPFQGLQKVRAKGLAIAVDLEDAAQASSIVERALEKELIITSQKDSLVMFPPLNITQEQADQALAVLAECV